MSDHRKPINLVDETTDTVSLRRTDLDALLADLEDAEDRAALLEHALAKATGTLPEPLTIEEAERLINGESPVKVWREKRGLTQRALAGHADISPSLLAEIERGTKTGSVETLRKLAHELKVDLDTLAP
jgi:ribosome-binding protein aMBF1 (putative translation factor)